MKEPGLAFAGSKVARGMQLSSAVAAILAVAGVAQAASAPALEEIIVTAERRATSEQTTAISMDVLTSDTLAESRTQTINDLQNATPSLVVNTQGISQVVNIRGIGNAVSSPSITVGIGIYTDGLLAGEPQNISGAYFDVDTIEVLRGPQGTFVGQASTGGAIRVNSKRPDFNGLSGYVEGVYGSFNNTKLAGAVNMPVSDTLAARVAFNTEQKDSYFRNLGSQVARAPFETLTQPGKTEDRNLRASLLWQPTEAFSALVRAEFNSTDHDGPSTQPNPRIYNAPVAGQPGVTIPIRSQYWTYDDPNHDPWVLAINNLGVMDTSTTDRFSADLRYKLSNGYEFRSLTGYQHNLVRDIEDGDASLATTAPVQLNIGPNSNYYTEELTLVSPDGPFNWVVGATWFYRQSPVTSGGPSYPNCGTNQGTGSFTACATNPTPTNWRFANGITNQRMGGLFGQLNWQFTDQLQLQVGARYSIDRNFSLGGGQRNVTATPTAGTVTSVCAPDILGLLPAGNYNCVGGPNTSGTYEGEEATWKVGLNWSPDGVGGKQFVYAFYARGYKPGGINGNGRLFEEEQVDDFELGWKGQLADGRVQLSLGGYWMDYKNMQQPAFVAGPELPAAAGQVANIGSSTIKGIEFEAKALLGNFTVGINSAYIDSELGDITLIDQRALPVPGLVPPGASFGPVQCTAVGVPAGCFNYAGVGGGPNYYVNLSGVQNVYSPELTYGATIEYAWDTSSGTVRPGLTYTHIDKQYTSLFQDEFFALEARNLLTVSVNYERDTWQVQGYCTNCADKTYIAAMDARAPYNVYMGAPRQLGIRVKKSF
jgi:iron complex outermembrane receptor protein